MVPNDGCEAYLGVLDMLVEQVLHIGQIFLWSHTFCFQTGAHWCDVLVQAGL